MSVFSNKDLRRLKEIMKPISGIVWGNVLGMDKEAFDLSALLVRFEAAEREAYAKGREDEYKKLADRLGDRHFSEYVEGFNAAREKAAAIAGAEGNAKRQCSLKNNDHNDLWCPTCDAMEDMAFVLEELLVAMKPDGIGK